MPIWHLSQSLRSSRQKKKFLGSGESRGGEDDDRLQSEESQETQWPGRATEHSRKPNRPYKKDELHQISKQYFLKLKLLFIIVN